MILKKIKETISLFLMAVAVYSTGSILTQCVHCPQAFAETKRGTGDNFSHITLGTKPIQKVYRGTGTGVNDKILVWENSDPPTILTFTVTPATIDLDTRSTGNVSLSWTATAKAGKTQTSNTYLEPQGTTIGQTYVTGANTGVSETFDYPQPNQTQIY